MSFSRKRRIIVEEFVEKMGYQIAGDGLSVDGKLVFRCFADDHFDLECRNPFVPISASFPCSLPPEVQDKVHDEVQRLLTLLNMRTSTYNFDIRVDRDYNIYLMEVAPRSGGNYIPQIIKYATGINLVEYSIKAAMGERIPTSFGKAQEGCWAYYAVHSLKEGILDRIEISNDVMKRHVIENHIIKKAGDAVSAFTGANTALGILLMKFDSMGQMLEMVDHSGKWIKVKTK